MADDVGGEPDVAPSASGPLAVAPGVVWRDLGDAVLVLASPDGEHLELGGSGVLVWRELAAGTDDARLEAMTRHAGAASGGEREQLRAFVAELIAQGLVRRGE